VLRQGARRPRLELGVEPAGERRDRRLRERSAAQLLGDAGDLAGRDTDDVHLHQGQHERLLDALIAGEQLCGEGAVTVLGHHQRERADARGQGAGLVAVALAGARHGALVTSCADMRGHLCFEHLLQSDTHDLA
jgi:hypothetical protein